MFDFGAEMVDDPDVRVVDEYWVARLGLRPEQVDEIAARENAEIERRLQEYRDGRPELDARL